MGKIIEPISKSEVFKKQQVKAKDLKETKKQEKDISYHSKPKKIQKPANTQSSKAKKSFSRAKSNRQGGPKAKKQRMK